MGMMEPAVNARIQDMRIVTKVSLSEEEAEFDGKSLSKNRWRHCLNITRLVLNPRRKEFLEMFFFAFHACGLRVVDVMTLQWKHIDFARKELRKIMIKTNKRHVIPLTEPALHILQQWREKREGCRYVFNLVKETLDLDDAEALYKARNNARNASISRWPLSVNKSAFRSVSRCTQPGTHLRFLRLTRDYPCR